MRPTRRIAFARMLCVAAVALALTPGVAYADETLKDPTVTKEVWEESLSAWGHRADASTGTPIRFRLTGTLPHEVYEGYVYWYRDELPEGMTADTSTVSAKLMHDGAELPVELEASVEGRTLSIGTDDLHAKAPDAVPGDELVVEYSATLDAASCEYGLDGDNANMVHLEFSQHDLLGNTGLSLADSVRVHTYQLRVRMVESGTGGALSGAKLALANQDGRYLTTDGTWVDKKGDNTVFVTDDAGEVTFSGVDAASYMIYQTDAPSGMVANEDPIGVAIKSEGIDSSSVQLGSTTTDPSVATESIDPASGLVVVVDARSISEESQAAKEKERQEAGRQGLPIAPIALGVGAAVIILGIVLAMRD